MAAIFTVGRTLAVTILHAQARQSVLIDQFLAALRALPEAQAELELAAAPENNGELALDVGGKPIRVLIELRKAVSRHRLLMNPIKSALIACARSR
jgi:hypothetical protein